MIFYVVSTLNGERLAGSPSFELAFRYASDLALEKNLDVTVIDDAGVKRARCWIDDEGVYQETII